MHILRAIMTSRQLLNSRFFEPNFLVPQGIPFACFQDNKNSFQFQHTWIKSAFTVRNKQMQKALSILGRVNGLRGKSLEAKKQGDLKMMMADIKR